MKRQPSKLALRFLEWFCPTELYEGIEGDLLEQFDKDVPAFGFNKAQWKFRGNVLRFFRFQILSRNHFRIPFIKTAMLKSYFVLGLRNIARHRVAAFINITGISIALTFLILSAFYVKDDYSFDRFNQNFNQIYRIQLVWIKKGIPDPGSVIGILPIPFKVTLTESVPSVEYSSRYDEHQKQMFAGEIKTATSVHLIDPEFFKIFKVNFVEGDANVNSPDNILLNESTALKAFGTLKAIGETVMLDEKIFTVAGIFEDVPQNSSLQFSSLISFENHPAMKEQHGAWNASYTPVFIKGAANQPVEQIQQQVMRMVDQKMNQRFALHDGNGVILQPLKDLHYDTKNGLQNSTERNYIYILIGLAAVILLTACINYTLISLAIQAKRGVEVGIRKVSGASEKSIRLQFFGEMQLVIGISLPLALVASWVLLPLCNRITGKHLNFTTGFDLSLAAILAGIVVSVGLISAIYPSIVLARATPQRVLKVNASVKYKTTLGNYLVVFQFASCMSLMILVLIMLQQMRFIETKDLGFKADQIVAIDAANGAGIKTGQVFEHVKNALINQRSVKSVSGVGSEFGTFAGAMTFSDSTGKHLILSTTVKIGFFEMISAKLLEGRFFDERFRDDTLHSVIINESLAKSLHREAVLGTPAPGNRNSRIIGIVKDFNFQPLNSTIVPMKFGFANKESCQYILVKISGEDIHSTLSILQKTWTNITGDKNMQYSFLDESIQRWYEQYYRWLNIMSWASGFGIFIASLGMFGLTGLLIVNRTKEIGIRRVLGATTENILLLLSKRYVSLIAVSFAIAAPIAWHYGNRWLSNFAYHIDLQYAEFIIPVVIVVAMVMLIIVTQSIKTIRKNPTESLRYE